MKRIPQIFRPAESCVLSEVSKVRRNRAPGLDNYPALQAFLKMSFLDPVNETDDLSVDNVRMGYWTHVAQTAQLDEVRSRKKFP